MQKNLSAPGIGSASHTAATDEPSAQFVNVWRMIRKAWGTAAATLLIVVAGMAFITLAQTKQYQAQATLQLDPVAPTPLGKEVGSVFDMAGGYWDHREYYETQYKIIQSFRVGTAVVRALDLHHDLNFLKNLPPGAPQRAEGVSVEDAAEELQKRLTVEAVKDSRLAIVRFEDADPARAQKVLATLIDTYIEQNLDDAVTSTNSVAEWLTTQLDKLKVELEESEHALHDYRIKTNTLSVEFDDQSSMLRQELKQLNDALVVVQTRQQEVAARRAELMKVDGTDPRFLPTTELQSSPVLQSLRATYETSRRERDSLVASGKGENHPEVQAATARVESDRAALLSEVRNVQGALDRDLRSVGAQQSGLKSLFEGAKKEALQLNLLEIDYNRLRRTKENTEKLYQLVLERTKENELSRMIRVNNLRTIDRPMLPRTPVRPKPLINMVFGTVAGVILGLAAALGRGMMDRSIKTPEDLERDLGLNFLGLLPQIDGDRPEPGKKKKKSTGPRSLQPKDGGELTVHRQPASGVAEAARAIRTNILFMAPDRAFKTLLITSSGPSEGKTTVACCVAIAMAQAGHRVVLVDCDLRRPRVHRVFGKTSEHGVSSALLGAAIPDEVLATEVPNLNVVPAGPIPPNPAELLHSDRFKRFLADLESRYDRVIIDSPPVAAVTDAAVLSTIVDATILVVRAFVTSRDLVKHGARALRDVGGNLAGVVLNAVDFGKLESYSYYYYRRDGYYAEPTAPGAAAPQSTTAAESVRHDA